MLDPVWSLVIASALAVIGGVIVYKQMVSQLVGIYSEEQFFAKRQQVFSRFLIQFGIAEAVPIIFLGYSILLLFSKGSLSTDVTPFLVAVLLIILFGALSVYFTSSQILRDPRVSAEMKKSMTILMALGFNLMNAVPTVSLGLLILIIFDVI